MKKKLILLCLIASIAFSETVINQGPVSGFWTRENSPYIIQGDIEIPQNDSLLIGPGVQVLFNGHYSLTAYGLFKAQGTEQDSILISSTHADTLWNGLKFIRNFSIFDYCKITRCYANNDTAKLGGTILSNDADLNITHSHIHHNSVKFKTYYYAAGAIIAHDANVDISNNIISFNTITSRGGGAGAVCIKGGKANLCYNKFDHNDSEGYWSHEGAGAIEIYNANASIKFNLIYENFGASCESIHARNSYTRLVNNTIVFNKTIYDNWNTIRIEGEGLAVNNIIYNKANTYFYELGNKVEYNCLYNIDTNPLNNNNFDQKPLFVDEDNYDFHLSSNSPCIDAGHPDSSFIDEPEYNGGRINLGCYGNTAEATVSNPQLLLLTSELNFDKVIIYEPKTLTITMTNEGETRLNINLSLNSNNLNNPFTCKDSTFSVLAGDTLNVPIAYKPSHASKDTLLLFISTNDKHQINVPVMLTGEGILGSSFSGTFEKQYSPYILKQDLTIQSGKQLIIEPGTTVLADSGVSIIINGSLITEGTEQDPIIFTSLNPNEHWDGLVINHTNLRNPESLNYCHISNANIGILLRDSSNFLNCSITNCDSIGILSLDHANILNCTITNCKSTAISIDYKRPAIYNDSLLIINNKIENTFKALKLEGDNFIIKNNRIENVYMTANISGSSVFINNTVTNADIGIYTKGPSLILEGNTLIGRGKPFNIQKRVFYLSYDEENNYIEGLNAKDGLITPGSEKADAYLTFDSKISTGERNAIYSTTLDYKLVKKVPTDGFKTNDLLHRYKTYIIKTLDGGHFKFILDTYTVITGKYKRGIKCIIGTYIPKGVTEFPVISNIKECIPNDGIHINNGTVNIYENGIQYITQLNSLLCINLTMKNNIIANFTNRGVATYNTIVTQFTNNKIWGNGDAGFLYHSPVFYNTQNNNFYSPKTIKENNEIFNNNGYQFLNCTNESINLPYTYWGPEDSTSVDNMILDQSENSSLGKVNFIPFLDAYNNPLTDIESTDSKPPLSFNLLGMYPNPANPSVNISFELSKTDRVEINIYNVLGQHIKSLCNTRYTAGQHNLTWYGLNEQGVTSPSGVYIVSIKCGDVSINKRMALVR